MLSAFYSPRTYKPVFSIFERKKLVCLMKQYIIKNLIDLIFENIGYSNIICNLQKFDILHASKN